jgi:hypothetical protein
MSDTPSSGFDALSDQGLTNFVIVTQINRERERIAGLRFSYLIRQHLDRGWTLEKLANVIGCHASLLSKWKDPQKVRKGLSERSGINDSIIQGVRSGLRVSSEYFFVSAKDLPSVVAMSDGTERPAEPGEVDCYAEVLSLEKKRGQLDQAARKQLAAQEVEITSLRSTVTELSGDVRRLTMMLERMLGGDAANRR